MKEFEEGIVNGLLRILFLLRVGAIIGLLSLFWFTPMPWKAIVLAPFVVPPLMVLGEQVLHRLQGPAGETLSPGQHAEIRRVRANMQHYRLAYLRGAEHTLAEMIEQVDNRGPARWISRRSGSSS